jgi:hypothetical protein
VAGVEAVLGDNFCGAYLQGSFAVGDADVHSDVDFIVVTEDDVEPERQAELQALHQALYALPTSWAQHLEGSYVPRQVLRRPDPDRGPLLYLDNGATEFALDNHDNTAIVRWSLREHGVVLAGPDPRELLDAVTADELRAEVRWALGLWQAWFRSTRSISRRALAVAVLSHARILHTLAVGEVGSKRIAGAWALQASTRSRRLCSAGHSKTARIRGRRCVSPPIRPCSAGRGSSSTTPPAGLPSTDARTVGWGLGRPACPRVRDPRSARRCDPWPGPAPVRCSVGHLLALLLCRPLPDGPVFLQSCANRDAVVPEPPHHHQPGQSNQNYEDGQGSELHAPDGGPRRIVWEKHGLRVRSCCTGLLK